VRIAIILISLLALCGCYPAQKKQAGLCELEAMRTYAGQELGTDAQVGAYIRKCMQVHGYIPDVSAPNCGTSDPGFEANPRCYEPDNWIGIASDYVESFFDGLERGL